MFYTFVILTVLIKRSDLCDIKWQVTSSENKPRIKCTRTTEQDHVTNKENSSFGPYVKTEHVWTDPRYHHGRNCIPKATKSEEEQTTDPVHIMLYLLCNPYLINTNICTFSHSKLY